jgi:hypothetical protein
VSFVQRNHLVKQLRSTTSQAALPSEGDLVGIDLCIAIQNDVTLRASFGKGLTQLLDDPLGSRVSSHVEVQNLPTSVLDDEEAPVDYRVRAKPIYDGLHHQYRLEKIAA